jgi:anti-anti-sigma factor
MIQPAPTGPDCSCTDRADDAQYHVDQVDECVVVTAGGQIDAPSLPALVDAINVAATFAGRIVIDLTRVTFLDPAGLDALNGVMAWARDSDESVSLVGPAGVVQTALEGAPNETFSVHDHVDDAEVALTLPAAPPPY